MRHRRPRKAGRHPPKPTHSSKKSKIAIGIHPRRCNKRQTAPHGPTTHLIGVPRICRAARRGEKVVSGATVGQWTACHTSQACCAQAIAKETFFRHPAAANTAPPWSGTTEHQLHPPPTGAQPVPGTTSSMGVATDGPKTDPCADFWVERSFCLSHTHELLFTNNLKSCVILIDHGGTLLLTVHSRVPPGATGKKSDLRCVAGGLRPLRDQLRVKAVYLLPFF